MTMRTLRIAAFVLLAAVAAIAQQADPPPADAAGPRAPVRKSAEKAPVSWEYDAMIAAAMRHPEIRIAEAKLRQAESSSRRRSFAPCRRCSPCARSASQLKSAWRPYRSNTS
jgi:hypothetical protein